jgi:hypothetical protein
LQANSQHQIVDGSMDIMASVVGPTRNIVSESIGAEQIN